MPGRAPLTVTDTYKGGSKVTTSASVLSFCPKRTRPTLGPNDLLTRSDTAASRDIRKFPVAVTRGARWWPSDLPSDGHQTCPCCWFRGITPFPAMAWVLVPAVTFLAIALVSLKGAQPAERPD
jgi:hypothetical protein